MDNSVRLKNYTYMELFEFKIYVNSLHLLFPFPVTKQKFNRATKSSLQLNIVATQ